MDAAICVESGNRVCLYRQLEHGDDQVSTAHTPGPVARRIRPFPEFSLASWQFGEGKETAGVFHTILFLVQTSCKYS